MLPTWDRKYTKMSHDMHKYTTQFILCTLMFVHVGTKSGFSQS